VYLIHPRRKLQTGTSYLVNAIREKHPEVPIIIIQSIIFEHGYFDQSVMQRVNKQNENINQEIVKLRLSGVKGLYLISTCNLLGDDHEGTVDGIHPNDLGFDRMLRQLKPEIMEILKKYNIERE